MDYAARLSINRYTIFLFHGVIERQTHAVRNYTRKHLESHYFRAALQSLIDAGGNPISLEDVVRADESKSRLPPKSFAITFDDGFLNNLTVAAPILRDMSIPATFYITTDFIDSNRMSWIDRIEWALESVGTGEIRLPWNLASSVFHSHDDKKSLLTEIRRNVKSDPKIGMDKLASDIQKQLILPETWSTNDHLDKKMNWDEVKELASYPLFNVGGHSHTHAILSFLSEAELDQEVDLSLSMLWEKARIGPRHYSYPEGLEHCYSKMVVEKLKRRGVIICPTAIDGENSLDDSGIVDKLFHLKRVMAV
jgi:peptidoglycan/xylan/chitin deacetylase (PgdA/CDA1 family)